MPKLGVVTGCAGFIGSHIVDRLLAEDWKVIGIDNLSTGKMENISHIKDDNFSFINADVTEPEKIDFSIFKGVDCVFHNAGKKMAFSVKQPREDLLTNIYGTLNMLLMAAENNAKKLILASSIAVYGNPETTPSKENSKLAPTTPYGVSKMSCEEYCRLWYKEYGLPIIILRYGSVYGPRQAFNVGAVPIFTAKILQDQPITVHGDGNYTRPFTYVEDVVQANLLAANTNNESLFGDTFNVASSKSVSIMQLIDAISTKLGKKPKVVHGPGKPGEIRHMVPDITKIRNKLKFEPSFSLEAGVSKTVEYYKQKQL